MTINKQDVYEELDYAEFLITHSRKLLAANDLFEIHSVYSDMLAAITTLEEYATQEESK